MRTLNPWSVDQTLANASTGELKTANYSAEPSIQLKFFVSTDSMATPAEIQSHFLDREVLLVFQGIAMIEVLLTPNAPSLTS